MKILFVVNPSSGRKRGVDWEKEIQNYFNGASHDVKLLKLEKDVNVRTEIASFKPDRVAAVGGDGTVTMLAQALGGTNLPMGILPAGSANGMAKELNIPDKPADALNVLVNETPKALDAIRINDRDICLHLSDLGLNAQLIKYFEAGSLRGMVGYAKGIFKVMRNKQRIKVNVETPNEEALRTAVMVAIANASKYGTGAVINEQGKPNDGVFEVVVVRKLGIAEMLAAVIERKRFNPKNVEVLPARSVSIETERGVHFQIDGEYKGKVTSVKAKILPAFVQVIYPTEVAKPTT